MTLVFCDSFDHYNTTALLSLKGYTSITNVGFTTGRNGSGLSMTATNSLLNKSCFSPTQTAIVAGVAYKVVSTLTNNSIISFLDPATSAQITARINSNGSVSIVRGAYNGTILATSTNGGSTPALALGVWYYVEFKVIVDNSNGYAEIKINGVSYITYSGDTQNASDSSVEYLTLRNPGGGTVIFDDLYVCSSTGTNSSFLGDIKVECKFANATGTYSEWQPSTGTINYQNVDETTPNDDTDYNSSSGTATADTFNFSDLSTISGQVFGVQRLLYARKDDAGSHSIAALHRNNDINSTGTILSLANTYAYYVDILEKDPSLDENWTISNFNSSEWGYEMIA